MGLCPKTLAPVNKAMISISKFVFMTLPPEIFIVIFSIFFIYFVLSIFDKL